MQLKKFQLKKELKKFGWSACDPSDDTIIIP